MAQIMAFLFYKKRKNGTQTKVYRPLSYVTFAGKVIVKFADGDVQTYTPEEVQKESAEAFNWIQRNVGRKAYIPNRPVGLVYFFDQINFAYLIVTSGGVYMAPPDEVVFPEETLIHVAHSWDGIDANHGDYEEYKRCKISIPRSEDSPMTKMEIWSIAKFMAYNGARN